MKTLPKLLTSFTLCISLVLPVLADDHKAKPQKNIVETAANAGQFETLLAAAQAAGLVSALSGDGPLTVFAPTDEAFGALPFGTIEQLLLPKNRDKLAQILTYHVVSGQIGSTALADEVSLKTLAGPRISFTQTEQGFSVEGARIIATDITASNGLVHVVDRVLMLPQTQTSNKMSRDDAQRMIMSAISKGVPMFNHGNPSATASIYTNTAQRLLTSAELTALEQELLQTGIEKSQASNNVQEQAWELRYVLDDVMRSLQTEQDSLVLTQ